MTKDGEPKEGKMMEQTIAGPLCFSGDLLATDRLLPYIEEGDIVVIHDTGAYTYSMHSRYNSRLGPAVYGYDGVSKGDDCEFTVVKAAEKPQDVWRFWDSPSYAEVNEDA
uniref:Orn/DAP/Arg decarboxylase 2 C-terminal domain-containing protein n=1 Tax=Lotharella oceanica TaxID=641309 RepID=A0A7S2THX2_9EUKA|mmetsp:Transcript_14979/g.28503  ORF Transcript_14979/g.28503 Transcript_14979/m.28503 type:complete len:110 (+) Transcript_14979:402-731(+)